MPRYWQNLKCKVCNEPLTGNQMSYCSPHCSDNRFEHTCLRCGELFSNKSKASKYCCHECYSEDRQEPEKLNEYKCPVCSSIFYDLRPRVCCSNECAIRYRSMKVSSAERSIYEQMKAYRLSERWREIRLKILERDNSQCQVCLRDHTEVGLHVHHIIPLREFWAGRIRDSEQLTNLITLCENCHPQVEWGKIECPVPKD